MKTPLAVAVDVLLVGSILLCACGSPATPIPTPTAEPTVETPTPAPATPPVASEQEAGGVDVAWQYVIEPEVDVVARVNGAEISAERYLDELREQLHSVTSSYLVDWNDEANRDMLPSFQDDVVVQMVREELALQIAAAEGIQVEDSQIEAELAALQVDVAQNGQFESWDDFLAAYGLTAETAKQQMVTYLIQQELLQAHGGPQEEEQVHATHILVDTRETGEEVLDKLEAGEAFADLATEYSKDTGSAATGGDLGWFARGAMVPEFEEAAFTLPVGDTSGLVQTTYGYHIIQVLGRELRPLEGTALEQAQQSYFQAWFEAQLQVATVETLVQFEEPAS